MGLLVARGMVGPWGRVARRGATGGRLPSMKAMRPRSSSVRSQRLFSASSACSRHASVQCGSWDRRRACVVSSSGSSPLWARVLWRALAGGSSNQVSLRSVARRWGERVWRRRLLPLRTVRAAAPWVMGAGTRGHCAQVGSLERDQ